MIYTIFRHKDIPWSICGLRLAGRQLAIAGRLPLHLLERRNEACSRMGCKLLNIPAFLASQSPRPTWRSSSNSSANYPVPSTFTWSSPSSPNVPRLFTWRFWTLKNGINNFQWLFNWHNGCFWMVSTEDYDIAGKNGVLSNSLWDGCLGWAQIKMGSDWSDWQLCNGWVGELGSKVFEIEASDNWWWISTAEGEMNWTELMNYLAG